MNGFFWRNGRHLTAETALECQASNSQGRFGNSHVANLGECEHLKGAHPLPLVLAIFPGLAILLEDELCCFLECRNSTLAISLNDRIDSRFDISSNLGGFLSSI
jgi:hypothetical protein